MRRDAIVACPLTKAAFSLFLLAASLGACATPPPDSDKEARLEWEQTNDPAEPTNRTIATANDGLDRYVIKPVAQGYRDYIPSVVRKSVRSFLTNMHEPWTFVNEVLQGELQRSGVTLGRFAVNSTAGVLGLFDLMDERLGEHHDEDFGQTLAVWGIGEGPYVVLPVFGPSNPRDTVGLVVGYIADPASLALGMVAPPAAMAGLTVVGGIDKREMYIDQLNEVERTSLDYYASLRSLYRQKRAADILNGRKSQAPLPMIYSLEEEPGASVPAAGKSTAAPAPVFMPGYSHAPAANTGASPVFQPPRSALVDEEQRKMDELVKAMRAKMGALKS